MGTPWGAAACRVCRGAGWVPAVGFLAASAHVWAGAFFAMLVCYAAGPWWILTLIGCAAAKEFIWDVLKVGEDDSFANGVIDFMGYLCGGALGLASYWLLSGGVNT